MRMRRSGWAALAAMFMMTAPVAAEAAQCGNTGAGFPAWVGQFKQEAAAQGVSPSVLDRAFAEVHYNIPTIRADRGQKSFKLSFDDFMRKRGGQAVISRGR